MAGDCSSSYVPAHVMSRPVPGRLHRAARRRAAQRDDRTVAPGAMDRMRLIDRPEEPFSLILNSMRELQSIQAVLAKILRKARNFIFVLLKQKFSAWLVLRNTIQRTGRSIVPIAEVMAQK